MSEVQLRGVFIITPEDAQRIISMPPESFTLELASTPGLFKLWLPCKDEYEQKNHRR